MVNESIKERMKYYDNNIALYEDVVKKLSERVVTYGDVSQDIAYAPEDKRAVLCHNVIRSLSSYDLSLNEEYKDIIEFIISNKYVGVSIIPSFYYIDRSYTVCSKKFTKDIFMTEFFPIGGKLTSDNAEETYNSHRSFTKVVYSFVIIDTNNILLRYANIINPEIKTT